jgi:molybdopterin/thiamine biosynthesis adenylyltransferase
MKKMKRNFSFDDKKLIERYSRQAIVPEFGIEGQKHLQASSAVIIGGVL